MVWVFSSGERPGLEFCCSILKIYNNILGVLDDRDGRGGEGEVEVEVEVRV